MQEIIDKYNEYLADPRIDTWEYLGYFRKMARGNVLEIGTRWGVSTTCFLAGVQDNGGFVYSIDINPQCASLFPNHPQWTFVLGDSVKDTDDILKHIPLHLDVLFIDGDHSYESVLSDLRTYGSLVKKGGLMLVHDVNPDGITKDLEAKGWVPEPGAKRAFEEYTSENDFQSVTILSGRAGLGVIRA